MALLDVIHAPDPRLKRKAEPVESVTDDIRTLMDDMLETMHAEKGIGLAAIQVGVEKRVIVVDVSDPEAADRTPLRMANPEVLWSSEERRSYEEGCLSLPDQFAPVVRPERIKVRYLDERGQPQEIEADGLLATCIQHEIDHLDGILFVDHISSIKRDMILRKLKKWKKLQAA